MLYPMDEIKDMVAANLKRLRQYKDMNRTQFAEHCGMRNGTYFRLEGAEVTQHIESLDKIAKANDLEVWQLLVPSFDPSNPPAIRQLSETEKEFYEKMKEMSAFLKANQ